MGYNAPKMAMIRMCVNCCVGLWGGGSVLPPWFLGKRKKIKKQNELSDV